MSHVCCVQTVKWIKIPLGTEIGLGPGDIVLDGDRDPHPKRGHKINMSLGTEVGIGPGDIVLDGDLAPPPEKGVQPHFSAHVFYGQTVAHLSNC